MQGGEGQKKKYHAIFKHIHQNIRAYCRSKKLCIDQWLAIYPLLGKIRAKRSIEQQVSFVSNTIGEL